MKKKIIFAIVIVVFVFYALLLMPKEFNNSYEGVEYRLGETGIIKDVTINFEGKLYRTWKLEQRFKGKLSIGDYAIPSKVSRRDYIILNIKNNSLIQDTYAPFDTHESLLYGNLFIGKDKRKLSIWVIENGRWTGRHGLMISAPARNRDEALTITNELMSQFLHDKFTEFK